MFSLHAISLRLFLILSLDPFLVSLLVLCPPKNAGGLLVSWCFQGAWNKDIGHIWVSQWDLIWMVVFPVYALWVGAPESMWFSGVFREYGIGALARDGSSKGNKYISAIKVKIQVRKKIHNQHRKRWKSALVCFFLFAD